MIPIGTRIQFVKTLDSGPDDYSPGDLYAVKGDLGRITGHGTREGYWVTWDEWPAAFGASDEEFKIVDEAGSKSDARSSQGETH